MNDKEKNEMIDKLVKGDLKPANEYVGYMTEKTQNTLMELDRVLMSKQRFARSLEQITRRETELRAALTTYGESIVDWQTKAVTDGGETPGVDGNEGT